MITLADYQRAEREMVHREGKRGFVIHAVVYAVVMTGLTVLNILLITQTVENFVWFVFPLIGWGIGLAMHYLHGVRWADRETQERQTKIEAYCKHCGYDLVRTTRDAATHQPLA
jgi:phosphate/sulfate permease